MFGFTPWSREFFGALGVHMFKSEYDPFRDIIDLFFSSFEVKILDFFTSDIPDGVASSKSLGQL